METQIFIGESAIKITKEEADEIISGVLNGLRKDAKFGASVSSFIGKKEPSKGVTD
jgi:hypothetical protein